jgi:hypothetical protein
MPSCRFRLSIGLQDEIRPETQAIRRLQRGPFPPDFTPLAIQMAPERTNTMPKQRAWRPGFDRNAPKIWSPEMAERIGSYPKSPEAYEAMRQRSSVTALATHAKGSFTRRGVPDGWGGRKGEALAARATAGQDAAVIYRALRGHNGGPSLDSDHAPSTDAERADFAMAEVIGITRDPTVPTRLRLEAARVVLAFAMPDPGRGKAAEVMAEDVLAALAVKVGLPPAPPLTKRS